MKVEYLPAAALRLIQTTARRHPPKIMLAVAGFFAFYAVMARLRSGRWMDSILLSLLTTAILVFVAACLYTLYTHSGYRFL